MFLFESTWLVFLFCVTLRPSPWPFPPPHPPLFSLCVPIEAQRLGLVEPPALPLTAEEWHTVEQQGRERRQVRLVVFRDGSASQRKKKQ